MELLLLFAVKEAQASENKSGFKSPLPSVYLSFFFWILSVASGLVHSPESRSKTSAHKTFTYQTLYNALCTLESLVINCYYLSSQTYRKVGTSAKKCSLYSDSPAVTIFPICPFSVYTLFGGDLDHLGYSQLFSWASPGHLRHLRSDLVGGSELFLCASLLGG